MASCARWAGATTTVGARAHVQQCCPGALGVSTPALAPPGLPPGPSPPALLRSQGASLLQGCCSPRHTQARAAAPAGAQPWGLPAAAEPGSALPATRGQSPGVSPGAPGSGHQVPSAAIRAAPRVPGDSRCTRGTCGSSRPARPAPRQAVFLKQSWRLETALARAGSRLPIHTSAPV